MESRAAGAGIESLGRPAADVSEISRCAGTKRADVRRIRLETTLGSTQDDDGRKHYICRDCRKEALE